jgi:hypothetical protein
MVEIFKVFYSTHYNFAALSLLLLLLVIFLLTKKNFKWSIVFLAVIVVINLFIWQRTNGKVWTLTEIPEETNSWNTPQPVTYKFYAPDHWKVKTEDGEEIHWCWVETYHEKFLSIDFVDKLWGTKEAKKLREASEERLNQ